MHNKANTCTTLATLSDKSNCFPHSIDRRYNMWNVVNVKNVDQNSELIIENDMLLY